MNDKEKISNSKLNCSEENKYIYKNQQKLRFGYTTGSCAAAAAKAATIMLLRNEKVSFIEIITPKGISLKLEVVDIAVFANSVICAIRKDSGDDPDVTNGILVYAKVSRTNTRDIVIDGGIGVGRVTKHGLECPVGSAAINKMPRKMIYNEVKAICEENDYEDGLFIEISIPKGEEIAKRTFNPRLGIVGGISILGTSGIIEPMSEAALIDTIRVEMKQLVANGAEYLVITPGNYGEEFSRKNMNVNIETSIKCSNFVGETIDCAVELGLKGILFIAHIGKFIKVAGGIMNTHSRNADARLEIITANVAMVGVNNKVLKDVMGCITTDEAVEVLIEHDIKDKTMKLIMDKIDFYLKNRANDKLIIGAIVFSNKYGILGETKDVAKLLNKLEKQKCN